MQCSSAVFANSISLIHGWPSCPDPVHSQWPDLHRRLRQMAESEELEKQEARNKKSTAWSVSPSKFQAPDWLLSLLICFPWYWGHSDHSQWVEAEKGGKKEMDHEACI